MDSAKSKQAFKQVITLTVQGLNHLLWPAVCVNCGQSIAETDNGLCNICWSELRECTAGDYCRRCGRDASKFSILQGTCPNCQGEDFYFDRIARSGVYSEALREMIVGFKNGRTELDSALGFLANSALQGSSFYNEIELFVPVPLHWSRRLVRGYNQSLVLAKKLERRTAEISTDLVRIRRTKSQSVVASPTARAKNVAGAFAVRYRHRFAGKTICLIDDIKTTGATLNECAKILKKAGVSRVFALVLAVAGQRPV